MGEKCQWDFIQPSKPKQNAILNLLLQCSCNLIDWHGEGAGSHLDS